MGLSNKFTKTLVKSEDRFEMTIRCDIFIHFISNAEGPLVMLTHKVETDTNLT